MHRHVPGPARWGHATRTRRYWNEIADACSWIRRQGQAEAWEIIWPLLQDGRALCVPGIIAVAQLVDVRQDSPSPWAAQGQYHWCLDVTPLSEPVPHKGAQGLWNLEPDALAQVRTLYREALKAKTAAA